MEWVIVLVRPSKPQNIGSILRLMKNFNFKEIHIVNPQIDLEDKEIEIVARRAYSLLEKVNIYDSLKDVVQEIPYLIGTVSPVKTGGDYNLRRVSVEPEYILTGEFPYDKVGIVFGNEQTGLTNEEIEHCNLLVTIPTNEEYQVMNLSHALAIISYFCHKKGLVNPNVEKPPHKPALLEERKRLLEYFKNMLEISEYHKEKQHIAYQSFENILSRGYITGREVSTLMGVFKWANINITRTKEISKA